MVGTMVQLLKMTRDGAAAARVAHNHEVPGSSPGPATKVRHPRKWVFFLAGNQDENKYVRNCQWQLRCTYFRVAYTVWFVTPGCMGGKNPCSSSFLRIPVVSRLLFMHSIYFLAPGRCG